jgi:DNA-binding MarR family transcriptional regulator
MMHMHHDSLSGCACTLLRKAARAVGHVYDEALAAHGMTTAQFAILRTIVRGEPLPLSRLAEQLVLDRTSLYRALAPLEARGWIAVGKGQGKTKLATLAPAGHIALSAAEADWHAVQARITGAMGDGQWAALQGALKAITGLAQEAH